LKRFAAAGTSELEECEAEQMQPAVALDGVQVIGETALPAVAKLRLITKGQLQREGGGEGKWDSYNEKNEQTGVCSAVKKKNQPVHKMSRNESNNWG
jgi:hypothetical protein